MTASVPLAGALAPGWPVVMGVGLSTEISAELLGFEPPMLVTITPMIMATAISPNKVHITRKLVRRRLATSALDSDREVTLEAKTAISGFGAEARARTALAGALLSVTRLARGGTGAVTTAGGGLDTAGGSSW